MIPRRGAGLLALAGAAVLAAPATALAGPEPWAPWRTTFLISRAADGGFPNGPSRNAQVSQDGRWGGRVAFESDATNVVNGDTNGATDIFVVNRRAPYPNNGSEWEIGGNERISMAADGGPANGRSYGPSIDGSPEFVRPHCVAFVSEASNLVAGDTNGQPDAFVRDLARNRTYRVSVDSRGRQANGPTTEVSIDGNCTRIAFTSRASNLAMTSTKVARQKVAVTGRPRAGSSQVYVHAMPTVTGVDKPWKNATWLASASSRGKPGNGDSFDPSIANQKGKATAFTSRATNLAGGDGNGTTDVYLRSSAYNLKKWTTRLVSANGGGRAGNGPSAQASAGGAGRVVAFATQASDVIPGDGDAQSDISRADMTGSLPSHLFVSKGEVGGRGNGPSTAPAISYGNQFVMFQSNATNFEPPYATRFDANGSGSDAFLWTINRRRVFTESVGSDSDSVGLPSTNPQQSSHGNYLFFETKDTSTDRRAIGNRPGSDAANAEQVYLRYLGPQ